MRIYYYLLKLRKTTQNLFHFDKAKGIKHLIISVIHAWIHVAGGNSIVEKYPNFEDISQFTPLFLFCKSQGFTSYYI